MRLSQADVDVDHAKWLPGQGEKADDIRGTGRCVVCRARLALLDDEWIGIVRRRRGKKAKEDSRQRVCQTCLIEGGMLKWLGRSRSQ